MMEIMKVPARRSNIIIKIFCLFMFLKTLSLNAQMLQDTASAELARKSVGYIYNLQFDDAGELILQISHSYPDHPVLFLLKGILTYWENYPLVRQNPAHLSFEEDMRRCIELSEADRDPEYEIEYLLSNLCARAMLLMFYADNDLTIEVIPLATSSYRHLRRSFDFNRSNPDLNYFTGLYNYYREAYPRIYPIYKSLAFMFPPGNTETGLKQLNSTALNSVFLRAESYFILAWINLYYENNFMQSLSFSKTLHELYPGNFEYLAIYIKSLLLLKRYDEAEILINASAGDTGNEYFNAQMMIFKGILEEKKHNDFKLAREYYNRGIAEIAYFGSYGNNYSAYAYFGLSRICESNGEKQAGKAYRRMGEKLNDFKKVDFGK
jgi:hypothetical protein